MRGDQFAVVHGDHYATLKIPFSKYTLGRFDARDTDHITPGIPYHLRLGGNALTEDHFIGRCVRGDERTDGLFLCVPPMVMTWKWIGPVEINYARKACQPQCDTAPYGSKLGQLPTS